MYMWTSVQRVELFAKNAYCNAALKTVNVTIKLTNIAIDERRPDRLLFRVYCTPDVV